MFRQLSTNCCFDVGKPMIFSNWQTTYFEADRTARFRLLLDRGAEINSLYPEGSTGYSGYSLAMFRASMGRGDGAGYVDALELLKRGADFRHIAKDGTTLASLLTEDRRWFGSEGEQALPGFDALCEWLKAQGALADIDPSAR